MSLPSKPKHQRAKTGDRAKSLAASSVPYFIVNPTSGGGRGEKIWEQIVPTARSLFGKFEAIFTENPKDGVRKTVNALNGGHRFIVACGGDGSLHDVVNGLCSEAGRKFLSETVVGLLPMGTGDDFRKSIGWSSDSLEALKRLREKKIQKTDVVEVSYIDHAGKVDLSYLINVGDFGFGGCVMKKVNQSKKTFGRKLTFLFHELTSFLSFEPCTVRIKTDREERILDRIMIGIVANGRYFGSGLCIAPEAEMTDGLLEVALVRKEALGAVNFLKLLPKLYTEQRIESEHIVRFRTSALTIEPVSSEPIWMELDGEQPGRLPATFKVLPRVLNLCV